MSSNRDLSELFRAIAESNVPKATEIAKMIAKKEEKNGHYQASRQLFGSLASAGNTTSNRTPSREVDNWTISQGLLKLQPDVRFEDIELPAGVRASFTHLLKEWKYRALLDERHVARRWKLLFHGPPGCGKSMTARAIAAETALPIYMVRFDSLIGAYLGQTALRLRELFRFANTTPCVLLFDEVDALAKRRGNLREVGELDRIVIAFMQELEHASSEGFIIATSNLPSALDDALWRRFDLHIDFPKPTKALVVKYAKRKALQLSLPWKKSFSEKFNLVRNFAEAERLVCDEARELLLTDLD